MNQLSLPDFIRKKRTGLGLTQAKVADRMGFKSPDYMSLVEQGLRNVDLDRIPQLAEILQVDPAELGKMALEHMYPVLSHCLIKGKGLKTSSNVVTDVDVATEKLKLLPRDERQLVVNMINMLHEKQHSGQRVGKKLEFSRAI
jgi:transcriptional regulator with XRE-family HTH domain